VVTDPSDQPDDQVVAGGGVDQRGRLDGLEVAGGGGRQDHGMGGWVGAAVLGLQVVGGVAVDVVDDFVGLVLDLAHDGVDLDGAGQVVDEVDEHPHAGQGEPQGSRDGQSGHEGRLARALDADGVQPGGAVGEGADKDAEDDLGAAVAHEVAQQPGRVLAGGDLQGDDGEGEDQPGDGDHGGGDHDQHIAGVVGGAPEGQRGVIADRHPRQQRPGHQNTTTETVGRTHRAPAR
jgi:hypothetical protein